MFANTQQKIVASVGHAGVADRFFRFLLDFWFAVFSALIRFRSSSAGSSFGSCGASLPVKAGRRMDERKPLRFLLADPV